MSTIDHQFIEFVVKSLVSKPDSVELKRTIDEKGVLLELTVDPEDLGRVIGKRGATAQSIRTLLRALGTKNDARYNLKIVDNGEQKPADQSSKKDKQDKQDQKEESKKNDEDKEDKFSSLSEDNDFGSEDSSDSSADEEEEKDENSYSRTRKELADLDDLDL